jgi:hypothetical protein
MKLPISNHYRFCSNHIINLYEVINKFKKRITERLITEDKR